MFRSDVGHHTWASHIGSGRAEIDNRATSDAAFPVSSLVCMDFLRTHHFRDGADTEHDAFDIDRERGVEISDVDVGCGC